MVSDELGTRKRLLLQRSAFIVQSSVVRSLRPCLGQGAFRRARVGRVRSLAILSILRECFPVVPRLRTIEGRGCYSSSSEAC